MCIPLIAAPLVGLVSAVGSGISAVGAGVSGLLGLGATAGATSAAAGATTAATAGATAAATTSAISPLTLFGTSLALTGASAGLSYMGQVQNTRAANAAANATAAAAASSYRHQVAQAQLQQLQARESTTAELNKNAVQAEEARARARTAAGEAGVSGLSIDALTENFNRQEAQFRAAAVYNFDIFQKQTREELRAARAATKGRVSSSILSPSPSPFVPLLATAGGGLDAYGRYLQKS